MVVPVIAFVVVLLQGGQAKEQLWGFTTVWIIQAGKQ